MNQNTSVDSLFLQIRQTRKRGGFSLVEVTLAIGIMACAILPLVAMLPIGLRLHRQAIDSTVTSQIVSRVTHEVQQTDFSTLTALAAPLTYYFDDQGNLLGTNTAAANSSLRLYDAQASMNKLPSVPAGTNQGTTTPSMLRVRIDIAANPGRSPSIFGENSTGTCTNMNAATYFAFVAKND